MAKYYTLITYHLYEFDFGIKYFSSKNILMQYLRKIGIKHHIDGSYSCDSYEKCNKVHRLVPMLILQSPYHFDNPGCTLELLPFDSRKCDMRLPTSKAYLMMTEISTDDSIKCSDEEAL